MTRILSLLLAASVVMLVPVQPANAQLGEQFLLIGTLERFTLDAGAPTDRLKGATMRVSGHNVVIPRNLLIRFPTRFMSPQDAFDSVPLSPQVPAGQPLPTGSRLALDDHAVVPVEVEITGNIVGTRYIAGLVGITQLSLATGGGYITAIDATNGRMRVGAVAGAPPQLSDATIQLNDPNGRFGPKTDVLNFDARFRVDADNPSVTADTGYPMCVQATGSPPYCAANNRPPGARLFVMGSTQLSPSPAGGLPVPPCPGCNQSMMAPLRVGDAIVYSGILHQLTPTQRIVTVYSIVANVGIYTAPGIDPAYVRIEGSLEGTAGSPTPRVPPVAAVAPFPQSVSLPDEAQDRFKVEGFTTDPTRSLAVYALDVNGTTGAQLVRRLFVLDPKSPPAGRFFKVQGKNSGILFGRDTLLRGNTREIMIRLGPIVPDNTPMSSLTDAAIMMRPLDVPGDTGVFPGRYVAPVDEYIFMENKLPGDRLVPNNFECLSFLVNGSGPLDGTTGPVVGQLVPWPNTIAAPVLNCGTRAALP